MKVPLADKASFSPLIQQVVGVATVLSNIMKVIGALAQIAFYKINSTPSDEDKLRKINAHLKDVETNFRKHVKYIGIGILRAIPGVGSLFSYRRISQPTEPDRQPVVSSDYEYTE